MGRFIIISFLFLGFAFYQLSGGADFDPETTRQARIETPDIVATEPLQSAAITTQPAPIVEKVKLDLATADEVLAPRRTLETRTARVRPAVATAETEPVTETEQKQQIIIPSLVEGAVAEATITPVDFSRSDSAAPSFDSRIVSGNRVNVRGGPGTDYQVVSRVVRGDEVEILEDPGNGWVQMRPVGGGPVGWVADFLLEGG